ncbi:Protein PAT1 homolog [Linum grandiflorum]
MDRFMNGGGIPQGSKMEDPKQFGVSSSGDALFDASQYAFFGKDLVEEVELGGLDDEGEDSAPVELEEEEFLFDRQEGEGIGSLSDIDDLSSTFSKLNKDIGGPTRLGVISDRGSRESSSAAEWVQGEEVPNWLDQQTFDADSTQDGKKWSSHPFSSSAWPGDPKNLYRTTSYPEQPQQLHQQTHQQFSSEPILVPKPSYPSYPPPDGQSPHASPNHSQLNTPYLTGNSQMSLSPQNLSPFSNPQLQMPGVRHGSPQYGMNLPQYASGLSGNNRPPSQWANQSGMFPADHTNRMNNVLQQQMPHQNGLMPPQMMPHLQQQQQPHRLHHQGPPSLSHLSGMQSQLFSTHLRPARPMMPSAILGAGDSRDQMPTSAQRGRMNMGYSQMGFDANSQRMGWSRFRSKYMSSDELEGILRMQLAATHSNDPYVDDYYNQGCRAKKSAGNKLRHHFCPTHLRDLPPGARVTSEPHAFLKVDALGRVPFSSIRRPRPLLEVEPPNSSDGGNNEHAVSEKPLEQEPLLAARVTIEDGLCLLLDVDDIDRFLEFNPLPDGGAHLRRRRQALLEGLATSLQLVDPLGKNGQTVGLAAEDDIVFLRVASLPKGRKLLTRYLQLLFPAGDLLRIVCMAVFRHLRFLFGVTPSDTRAAETTNQLARTVSFCVRRMDLGSLSACLAAVVCSSEQPPLRPLSSSAGNGASVILVSVLERASEMLTEVHDASNYGVANRALWNASFDEFFGLLIKYCVNKYDGIMQSPGLDPADAIKRELPMELLRASVPHTNDYQKKMMYDLSQRSLAGQDKGNGSLAV